MAEFARRWGKPVSTVYMLEIGINRNPGYTTLQSLVDTFGVDPRLFFTDYELEVGDGTE